MALIEKEHGDLTVTTYQGNDSFTPHAIQGIEVVTVKPVYPDEGTPQTYAFVDKLKTGGWGGGPMFLGKYQRIIEKRPTLKVAHIYYNRA